MLTWLLQGWLVMLIIVSLLIYPLCLLVSYEEALRYGRQLVVILGWGWVVAAVPTRWLAVLVQRRHVRGRFG